MPDKPSKEPQSEPKPSESDPKPKPPPIEIDPLLGDWVEKELKPGEKRGD